MHEFQINNKFFCQFFRSDRLTNLFLRYKVYKSLRLESKIIGRKKMGRRRLKDAVEKEHITQDILLGILKTGVLLTVAIVAPNILQVINSFVDKKKEWENYYPSSVGRQITKLWRKGWVEVKETKDGQVVTITDKGKTEILKYNIENLSIPRQELWDGKWRMVFFDIATGYDLARHTFQKKLKALGFFQMQKSVYIYPYPCEKEVKFLREIFNIPHSVKLAKVERLENDLDLRKFFRL